MSQRSRSVIAADKIHPAIQETVAAYQEDLLEEVKKAVASHDVVVVGMSQNPFPRKARKLLREAGIEHQYLEYGSYFGQWRRRLALKMWTGWPTLPMIFIKGVFVGGFEDLKKLHDSGELKQLLA